MRIERLEYGDSGEYPEDFNSFKVYTVWSEPDIKKEPNGGIVGTRGEDEERSKRLAVAVEFTIVKGGYFFVERPEPGPDWICKVFDMLKEEGWQGHSFQEFRVDCRGDISIEEGDEWVAVIDEKKEKVFHNRGKRQGDGAIDDLEEF